jgi:hypothetical protein
MEQRTCPKCGSANTVSNQFCLVCGDALQNNCPNCGNPAEPNLRFCQICGAGLGWGAKLRDIQYQIVRSEGSLTGILTQNSYDIKSELNKTEDNLKAIVAQYSSEIQAQQLLFNDTASNINRMVISEHGMGLSRLLNRSGLGVIGVGLAIIGLAYVLNNSSNLAMIGAIVVAIGFLLQLISNFL